LFTNRSKEEVLEQVFCEMGSAQIWQPHPNTI
jgi:hypothetical protein